MSRDFSKFLIPDAFKNPTAIFSSPYKSMMEPKAEKLRLAVDALTVIMSPASRVKPRVKVVESDEATLPS
jgi:hypothetical protein